VTGEGTGGDGGRAGGWIWVARPRTSVGRGYSVIPKDGQNRVGSGEGMSEGMGVGKTLADVGLGVEAGLGVEVGCKVAVGRLRLRVTGNEFAAEVAEQEETVNR